MMYRNYFALALLVAASNPCSAWESEEAVYPPAPVATLPKSIVLDAIDVDIKGDQITVKYSLQNKGESAKTVTYSVYLPMFQWQGVGAEYADRNIPEFAVSINSSPITVNRNNFAYLNGKDISKKLLAANVNPELVASWEQSFKYTGDASKNARMKDLISDGAFQVASEVLIPKWHLLSTRTWRMTMAGQSTSTIATHYRARPEFAVVKTDDKLFLGNLLTHCGTPSDFTKIGSVSEYAVVKRYVIPVQFAENLSPLIRWNFDPKVVSSNATAYTCVAGKNSNATDAPSFKAALINSSEKFITVLLVSPQ